jgi:hypothetical protein
MSHRRSSFRPGRDARGSTLVVTVVLLTVLLLIGVAVIRRSQLAGESASLKRQYDASVSCADGAREMLLSQFRAFNVSIKDLQIDQTLGDRRLASGHYDQFNIKSVRPLAGTGAYASDVATGTANKSLAVPLGGAPYVFTVVCSDSSSTGRQVEIEYFIRFGI